MVNLIAFGSILAELQVDISHPSVILPFMNLIEINQPSNVNAIS